MPSPKKKVTRYGAVKEPEIKFGNEQRFQWQKAKFCSDVVYDVVDANLARSVSFGCSLRGGADDADPDAKKRSTGPGSYDFAHCFDSHSEYATSRKLRFPSAPRQSMAMKTPSPGAVYDIDKQYYTGKESRPAISFNCDERPPLYSKCASANADMNWPKLSSGPSVTIGAKLKYKDNAGSGPGPVYDVHKVVDFRTGPSFSFGRGKGSRFTQAGFLPELD